MSDEKKTIPEKANTNPVILKPSEGVPTAPTDTPNDLKAGGADAGTPGGRKLARPNAAKAAPKRRRRNRWVWAVLALVLIGAGVGGYFWYNSSQTTTGFTGQTNTVNKTSTVGLTVSATGQVQAKADLALTFSSSGTITEISAKQGDLVKKGQVIAKIDDRDLQTSVKTSLASLNSAKANLEKTKESSSETDIQKAEEQVKQAKISAEKTKNGNSLPEEIQSARAQLASAQATLEKTRQGGTPAEKASAESSVSSAQASLSSAQAKLDETLAGPTASDISNAQLTYDQAVTNLEKNKSSLYTSIVNAQVARDQALNSLKKAQDAYSTAYNDNHEKNGKLKGGVSDDDIQKETDAKRSLEDAQGSYNKADVAVNDAKVAYDTGVRNAQSTLDNAKVQLDKTKAGPTASEIASAKANVDSAKANLDSAKSSLTKLTPSASDLASAQASVASANSSLAKLVSGGTQADIDNAESNVKVQELTLQNLLNGPTTSDLAIQQASVDSAQANYDKALVQLDDAVLKAPFDGLVSSMSMVTGQAVTAATTIAQLIDTTELHVDMNVGESDISKIKLSQAVTLTFDAIANRSFTGKITFIAPKSTVSSNVVSYVVTVTLDAQGKNALQEAFPQEFQKYQQTLQQSLQGGQQGGTAGGFPGGGQIPTNIQIPAEFQAQINSLRSSLGFCGYSPNIGTSTQSSPKVGMTASLTVCLDVKAGVLSVPTRAIKTNTQSGQLPTSYVEVLDAAGNKVKKTVTTGLKGDTSTEVTGGELKEGDKVIISTTPTNTSTSTFPGFPGAGNGNVVSLNR